MTRKEDTPGILFVLNIMPFYKNYLILIYTITTLDSLFLQDFITIPQLFDLAKLPKKYRSVWDMRILSVKHRPPFTANMNKEEMMDRPSDS